MKYIIIIFILTGCGKAVNKDAPAPFDPVPVSPEEPLKPNEALFAFANYNDSNPDNYSTPIQINEITKVKFLGVLNNSYIPEDEIDQVRVWRLRNGQYVFICYFYLSYNNCSYEYPMQVGDVFVLTGIPLNQAITLKVLFIK